MNKCIILTSFLFVSQAYALDTQELINCDKDKAIYTLNYIRQENKQAAEILEKLYLESEDAVEKSKISKLIDILLQACIYLVERIKHFEENFHTNPELLDDFKEEVDILKEL